MSTITLEQKRAKQQEEAELRARLAQLKDDLGPDSNYTDTMIDEDEEVIIVPPGIQQLVCVSSKHKIKEVITFRIPPSRKGIMEDFICKCGTIYRLSI